MKNELYVKVIKTERTKIEIGVPIDEDMTPYPVTIMVENSQIDRAYRVKVRTDCDERYSSQPVNDDGSSMCIFYEVEVGFGKTVDVYVDSSTEDILVHVDF